MSGTLASPGGAPESPQAAGPQKPRKAGCGCLGSLGFVILLVVALLVLLNPWSLHIGQAMDAGAHLARRGPAALDDRRFELYPHLEQSRRGPSSRQNVEGTGKICTPQGQV